MSELLKITEQLFTQQGVNLLIGYSEGSAGKLRPVFITSPQEANQLVIRHHDGMNLTAYLTKPHIKAKGRIAIIASLPEMRSVVQLAAENQVNKEETIVIGVLPNLELKLFASFVELESFVKTQNWEIEEKYKLEIEKIKALPLNERWSYWKKLLEPCIRCYACRAACPMCYCTKCTVECNQPQWIPAEANMQGVVEWHIMRAMHMAGRCSDCNACFEACPLGLPINLLTKNIMLDVRQNFSSADGDSGSNVLSVFRPGDKENFIR
jgi:ferredoxin